MKDKIQNEIKEALRAKDQIKLNTLRGLKTAIEYEEIQKKQDLKEDQIIAILKNEIKKRKEAIEYLEKDSRTEEIATQNQEIEILNSYLPQQLSEEKLTEILTQFKEANPDANMGMGMKHLKDSFAGQYDGKTASTLAKQVLG